MTGPISNKPSPILTQTPSTSTATAPAAAPVAAPAGPPPASKAFAPLASSASSVRNAASPGTGFDAGPAKSAKPASNGGGIGGFFKKIGEGIENAGAKSVGYLEMAGLRYPVSHYSSKVSDTLTRGSRLSDDSGYKGLKDQGFKSIVDLTAEGTDNKDAAAKAGLNTMQVPTIDNSPPTVDQMRQLMGFLKAPENQPAYIHCEAGVGRTGVATACYRMSVEGWSADQATAEAEKFGLHVPSQLDFIKQFGAALDAGQMPELRKPAT